MLLFISATNLIFAGCKGGSIKNHQLRGLNFFSRLFGENHSVPGIQCTYNIFHFSTNTSFCWPRHFNSYCVYIGIKVKLNEDCIVTGRLGRACETHQNQMQVRLLCGSTQLFCWVSFHSTQPTCARCYGTFFCKRCCGTQHLTTDDGVLKKAAFVKDIQITDPIGFIKEVPA